MKLSCTKENLHQGLSIASHQTGKQTNLPVLQNVLIKAEGGNIRFTTTNLEIAVSCSVRGKVTEDGEHTLPSKLFSDYVSLLPNETVEIVLEGDDVGIVCGNQKTRIKGISASEFPLVPDIEGGVEYQVPAEALRLALSQVLFAVAANESRPELTGVCMTFSKDWLVLAATDSYRLGESRVPLQGDREERKVILPARMLSEVARILSSFKDDVDSPSVLTLTLSDSQAGVRFGPVELVSRIIEGNYPDYRQIIPKEFQTTAILDREDAIKAVKTASLFSKTGLFDVLLDLEPNQKRLSVKATDANRGENTAVCQAETDGKSNAVTVNYRYLLDGLQAIGTEKVAFKMIDASNPCLLMPQGEESSAYLYLVMPIKQ